MSFRDYAVDSSVPIPLYFQLKNIILAEIEHEKIPAHENIPTEMELCELYHISRTTVRQAISELVNEGKLYRIKSKGTFVSPPQQIQTNLAYTYFSFFSSAQQLNMNAAMKLLSMEIVDAPAKVLAALSLSCQQKVVCLKRLQVADNTIISYIDSYLLYPLCAHVMDAQELESSSLYHILSGNPATSLGRIVRQISVHLAKPETAELLQIQSGDPILMMENTGIALQTNQPMVVEWVAYVGEKNTLVLEQTMVPNTY